MLGEQKLLSKALKHFTNLKLLNNSVYIIGYSNTHFYFTDVKPSLRNWVDSSGKFQNQHVKPQQFRSHILRLFQQKHFHNLDLHIVHPHSARLADSCCHSSAKMSSRMTDCKYWRNQGKYTCWKNMKENEGSEEELNCSCLYLLPLYKCMHLQLASPNAILHNAAIVRGASTVLIIMWHTQIMSHFMCNGRSHCNAIFIMVLCKEKISYVIYHNQSFISNIRNVALLNLLIYIYKHILKIYLIHSTGGWRAHSIHCCQPNRWSNKIYSTE